MLLTSDEDIFGASNAIFRCLSKLFHQAAGIPYTYIIWSGPSEEQQQWHLLVFMVHFVVQGKSPYTLFLLIFIWSIRIGVKLKCSTTTFSITSNSLCFANVYYLANIFDPSKGHHPAIVQEHEWKETYAFILLYYTQGQKLVARW